MRKRTIATRAATLGLAASMAAVGATSRASNAEAKAGIGIGAVSTSVLDAALGDLLGLRLLEDVAASTNDPKTGPPGASSVFKQLQLSSTISALNRVVGEHKVSAPQGPAEVSTSLLDLNSLGLGAVLNGTLEPITLKAQHTPRSATASTAKITDLGLLGGLGSLGILDASDQTGADGAGSEAARAMSLDALSLLDLGKLLQGLGLDILNLPLSVISGLVTSLGIPVDLQGASSLQALVTSLASSIQALVTSTTTTVTAPLVGVLDGLGLPVPLQPTVDTVLNTAITTLTTTLTNLVNTVVGLLESATVLKVNALDITTVAKAADTVAASTATADGKLGGIQVGPLNLPGVDLLAATAAVNNLLAQIQAALGGILAPLGLGDLLSVKLFDKQTGVTEAGGVVKAVSAITGLVVKLTPPSLGLLGQLNNPAGGLGSILSGTQARAAAKTSEGSVAAAAAAPAQAAAVPNPLEAVLGVTSVLSKGLEVRVGTVQSQSLHAVNPATPLNPDLPGLTPTVETPDAPGSLPRTGGEQTVFALVAMGLAGVALGARRLRQRARI